MIGSTQGGDQLSLTAGIIFTTCVTYCFILSTMSLIYILFKLKLNKFLKILLIEITLVNSACTAIIIGSLILFAANGFAFSVSNCQLLGYPLHLTISTPNMLNVISIFRYYMSKLASKSRILSLKTGIFLVSLAFLINPMSNVMLLLLQDLFNYKSLVSNCLNETHVKAHPLIQLILALKAVSITIIGLYCDISLFFFIKKRNNQVNATNENSAPAAEMIPWKSSNSIQNEEDLQIPVKASLFSFALTCSIFFFAPLYIYLVSFDNSANFSFWLIMSIHLILASTTPLIVIFFTIKQQDKEKKTVQSAQPPAQLQFHEESENLEAENETNC